MDSKINEYKEALKKAVNKINTLNAQVESLSTRDEIAVIGYSCRFPGGANSPEKYWELLKQGFNAVTEIRKDRFDIDQYYSNDADKPGTIQTRYASFLDWDITGFDNSHFEILPNEAASIDPQHRLLLEVSWEALQNSGVDIEELKGSNTGVFIGAESFDYVNAEFISEKPENITPYTLFGVMPTSAAGRLSYFYDLKGPAMACDTACSSSLVALNSAVQSLKNGQCDMAIVGGVNLILRPEAFIGLSQINSLSANGTCKTFDADADGFGRGEGCGILVLKRLADAKKDGNAVEALVRGIGIGQDGKSNGYFAPNGLAEQRIMKCALKEAGISPDSVDYVETHGTGTALGDTIEASSISSVYQDKKNKMYIGSAKTNFGHLEAASGMASMIKVLLSMKHKQFAPSIHFHTPNPNINWEKLQVVTKVMDWNKKEGKRRAAVSSYGISGTLAHLILEEPDDIEATGESEMTASLVTISAKNASALKPAMRDFADYLKETNDSFADIAYSSNIMKSYEPNRYAAVGSSKEEILSSIEEALEKEDTFQFNTSKVKKKKDKIAFLFTGQGSIYNGIAKQFYEHSKEYREVFDVCEELFWKELGISVKKSIFEGDAELLRQPLYSQAIIFTVEYSLTKVWESMEIIPSVVIGHSIGEYAASCCAGVLRVEDAVKMIAARAKMMSSCKIDGKMAGILTNEETIRKAIQDSGCKQVAVAAVNAPLNVTISGLRSEVDQVIETLHKTQRTFVNDLGIQHPYHSRLMSEYEQIFEKDLEEIQFQKLKTKMISTVTGKLEKENVIGTKSYWARHLSQGVQFKSAIDEARKQGINVFIEIGGNATLSGLAQQCLNGEDVQFVPSLRKDTDDYSQILDSVKTLYLNGVSINWKKFYGTYQKKKVYLPAYPFQKKKYWRDLERKQFVENDKKIGVVQVMEKGKTKYEVVQDSIIEIVHMITGMEKEDIELDKELIAFGFDSLLMASLGKQLQVKYNYEISMDKLFTTYNTLEKIATNIADTCEVEMPEEKSAPAVKQQEAKSQEEPNVQAASITEAQRVQQVQPVNMVTPAAPATVPVFQTVPMGNCSPQGFSQMNFTNQFFQNQLQIMHEQNSILQGMAGMGMAPVPQMMNGVEHEVPAQNVTTQTVAKETAVNQPVKTETKPVKAVPEKKKDSSTYYVPYHKLTLEETSKMENLQQAYIKQIEKLFTSLTKKSKETTQKYRKVYASNRNSAGFRPAYKEMLYQIIAQSGHGATITDIDGNELVDVTMGFGVSLFGHEPKFVRQALLEELENGMPLGPMGRLSGEVARQISELTGVERVFFCNSGTEADMFAVRIARAVTRKNKVVAFKGAFHGTYDGLLGVPSFVDNPDNATLPMAPGITDFAVKDLILLDYNDESSLRYLEEHSDIIAAVITEPVQSRRPDIQPREFLQALRKVTKDNNIALIFDEIITGFRICSGGAQDYFGVEADIVTYGKVVGGGMPIGILSGKSEYLDSIDGGMWQFGDNSVPPCDDKRTFVAGTFCHHPLAMASCHAVLNYIKENKDTLYPELNEKTGRFVTEMNQFFEEEKVPVHINHFGSLFRFNITLDREIFYYGLLAKGIYVWEGRNCFFSTEHKKEHIDKFMNAIKSTISEMKTAGYFGKREESTDPKDPDPGGAGKKKGSEGKEQAGVSEHCQVELAMSLIQQRLYSHILMKESDPFDIVSAYYVEEKLNIPKMETVINEIISRHEILRSVMFLRDGEYRQAILDQWDFKVRQIEADKDLPVTDLISKYIVRFELDKAPLMETLLIKTVKGEQVLVFHFHHIVSDGISMNLFVQEFGALYAGKKLEPLKHQYKDFVDWEKGYIESGRLEEDEKFWIDRLRMTPRVTAIPYDYVVSDEPKFTANSICEVISKETLSRIKKLAIDNKVTLYMLLLSMLDILLHKTTRESDIALFTPTASRFDGGFEECIGMFTNTVVLNNELNPEESFEKFVQTVKQNFLASYNHFDYPYNLLMRKLNIVGQNGFNIGFVYENVNGRSADLSGIELKEVEFVPTTQETDITFELLESKGTIDMFLRYRSDLYSLESCKRLLKRFDQVINQILDNPQIKIADIDATMESEKQLILNTFNNTYSAFDTEKTLVDLWEEQVEKQADRTVLIFEDEQISYAELDKKANIVAAKLRKLGVKPNDFVALIAERGIEMIAGLIGILKSGGAYVPIDPEFPEERIQSIFEDCKPKAALCYKGSTTMELPVIDLSDEALWKLQGRKVKKVNKADDLAYLMYTSGTTGKPKGIQISHKNVHGDIHEFIRCIGVDEDTISLQQGTFTFDMFVQEFYPAITCGGTVVMAPKRMMLDIKRASDYIEKHKVNLIQVTPLILNEINKGPSMPTVKTFIVGGDKLKYEYIDNIMKSDKRLFQSYGPTENTVIATCIQLKDYDKELIKGREKESIPIGKPKWNTQIYIIDSNNNLCGLGIAGELCISGVCLTRGYLNRPEMNAEKFVQNPFGEGKMYHTGDLARWLPDGNIEFLGRIDAQVKIRGIRIEPAEIDTLIRKLDYVKDCTVFARVDGMGELALYAYLVSDQKISMNEVKSALKLVLPDNMIPSYMMQIDALPMTKNGKVDQRALPDIEKKSEQEYMEPRTETEAVICDIFKDILHVEQVGIKDSFFELGGHSLRATKLVNEIEVRTGRTISVKDVFTYQNPESMAKLLEERLVETYGKIPLAEEKEYYPMSSTQKRTFLIWQMDKQGTSYNMPGIMKISGDFDVKKMEEALQSVFDRHEILRTEFLMLDGEPVQHIVKNITAKVDYVVNEETDEMQLIEEFEKPFNLEKAPLMRVKVVKRKDYHLFLIDTHHIISDGMSMLNFQSELTDAYNGVTLKPLNCQYKDYSEWMRSRDLSSQEDYWVNQFSDDIPVLELPLDAKRPQEQSYAGNVVKAYVPKELGVQLKALTAQTGTTAYMVYLSTAMVLLHKYSRQEDIVIGNAISARTHKDTESMMGMFVNTLAMRGKPAKDKTFTQFLEEMKQICLQAYENQEYPFEDLVEKIGVQRDMSRNPIFDVILALQNNEREDVDFQNLQFEPITYDSKIAKFDITFDITEYEEDCYQIKLEYCTALWNKDSMERMLNHFLYILTQVTQTPDQKIKDIMTATKEEQDKIFKQFNDTTCEYPADKTISEFMENQVAKTPDKVAVVYDITSLTYQELNERANVIANKLRTIGVGSGDFVAVLAKKSVEVLIGICGIVKSGGAYVPIDPSYPQDRIDYILSDCKPKAILLHGSELKASVPVMEISDFDFTNGDKKNPENLNSSEDLAYCIYTSGTTGKPKGVMIEQKSIIKLVKNCDYTELDDKSVILQTGQLAFDASTFEIWGALLNGGCLHMIEEAVLLDSERFHTYLVKNKINTMFMTTALFNQMIGDNIFIFDTLKHLMFGGEASSEEHIRLLREHNHELDFRNVYGPTETTTFASHYIIKDAVRKTPIGKPIRNTKMYLVNDGTLCGIGVPGELCITGDGLARGYLNNEELTKEKFVDNPYGEGKMYRSGDLARWLPDGNIEYLGRIDQQVKIRGFRIELQEIANAISAMDVINDCAVIVRNDANGDKALYAYYVASQQVDISAIKDNLKKKLPHYMVPAYMMQIDRIPVTFNGKLNKNELPVIETKEQMEYVEPETDEEIALCNAFAEVLNLERVGKTDSFFEIGGDSIKAVRVITALRTKGYSVTVQNILQCQTAEELKNVIKTVDVSRLANDEENSFSGVAELGAIQNLFIKSKLANPDHFNMSVMFESEDRLVESVMKKAVQAVIQYHDMLRVTVKDGVQTVRSTEEGYEFHLNSYDWKKYEEEECQEEMQKAIKESQASLSLEQGIVLSLSIFHLAKRDHIHICIHHFVCDAISIRMIAEDMFTAYYYTNNQEQIRFPHKTDSFADWVSRLNEYVSGESMEAEKNYWRAINETTGTLDFKEKSVDRENETADVQTSANLEGLRLVAQKVLKTGMDNVFITAIAKAAGKRYGKQQCAIAMEGYGRYDVIENIAVDRTVGWFTNIYPLVFAVKSEFADTLNQMLEERDKVPHNGILYLPAINELPMEEIHIPQIAVNYLGSLDSDFSSTGNIKQSRCVCGNDVDARNQFLSSLSINIMNSDDNYQFNVVYDKAVWDAKEIEELQEEIINALKDLLDQNQQTVNEYTKLLESQYASCVEETQKELSRYEESLVSTEQYEDYPLTGIQRVSFEIGSRNAVMELMFFDQIDVDRFRDVWSQMVQSFDVLRSSIALDKVFIRLYANKKEDMPFVDISRLTSEQKKTFIKQILEDMDCYEDESLYTTKQLSSKSILVKESDTCYRMILSCTHMIFDRYSADILKHRIQDVYYQKAALTKNYPYKDYYEVYRNRYASANEEELMDVLGIKEFYQKYMKFYEVNEKRNLDTYIYHYQNREKWEKLSEKQTMYISETVFIKAMKYVFKDIEIPLMALHIARKSKHCNLFEYIGECLDVIPTTIPKEGSCDIQSDVQKKFAFMESHDVSFSSLLYEDSNDKYISAMELMSQISLKMSKLVLVYNHTGILKDANDVVVNSDKYRLFYNVMSVAINVDGIFMNIPAEEEMTEELDQYLDKVIEELINECME